MGAPNGNGGPNAVRRDVVGQGWSPPSSAEPDPGQQTGGPTGPLPANRGCPPNNRQGRSHRGRRRITVPRAGLPSIARGRSCLRPFVRVAGVDSRLTGTPVPQRARKKTPANPQPWVVPMGHGSAVVHCSAVVHASSVPWVVSLFWCGGGSVGPAPARRPVGRRPIPCWGARCMSGLMCPRHRPPWRHETPGPDRDGRCCCSWVRGLWFAAHGPASFPVSG